jgi:hypothetical protein
MAAIGLMSHGLAKPDSFLECRAQAQGIATIPAWTPQRFAAGANSKMVD